MSHFVEKCREHGTLIRQCRCFDKNKSVRLVACPGESWCTQKLTKTGLFSKPDCRG